jgi:predicted nucleic acid-binding protein
MMENQVFLDSAYAIALASRGDEHHQKAEQLSQYVSDNSVKLVTSRAVCLEIGNALSKLRFRRVAVDFLAALDSAPAVQIVPATEDLYRTAFDLF